MTGKPGITRFRGTSGWPKSNETNGCAVITSLRVFFLTL
jgi:hypothetical protein